MRASRFAWSFGLSIAVAACGGGEADPSGASTFGGLDAGVPSDAGAGASEAGTEPDASEPDAGPVGCGTASKELPPGLLELSWNDGEPSSSLREQTWTIEINGHAYALNEEPLHEAVRFDIEHPAKIHGFAVQWAGIPENADPTMELEAGLYPDFGYNGFDFWAPDPYWTGTRCAEDAKPGEWVTYAFPEPIVLDHPGLVYVAHRVAGPGAPVFPFDGSMSGDGECDTFDECHSSMNLPEAETSTFFNGVSFMFQYDYLVRLYVEYTEEVAPEDRYFQQVELPAPKSHVSVGDYDADGFDDLVTDGPTLYRNQGDGTFVDATESSGIAAMGLTATGGVFGDYDNDGCLDLFLYAESHTAPDVLLHSNCDGTFTDATEAAGIVDFQTYNDCGDPANVRSPSAAAAWIDIDADGLLDLYLSNFICWSEYTYYVDTVWHNVDGTSFEEWTKQHGFSSKTLASRGANPVDYDGDGDVDLHVNTYVLHPDLFFENQGDGTVVEKAQALGVAGTKSGPYFGHTIGTAWGDLDGDGDFDLVAANLAHPRFFDFSDKTQILLQQPDGTFADASGDWLYPASAAGLRYQETHSVPALADFDADGNLDLVITAVYDGRPTDFYWGKGDGTFVLDAYRAGITTENGWGAAISDFDNDGDPDVFAYLPFRNELAAARKGHFVQVRAIGNVASNTAAIGSTVRVTAGGVTRMRHVQGGTGKGGQDSMYLHFGLADATKVDSIEVTYPGGKKVAYPGPFEVDQRIWVFEDGGVHLGWAPPPP